MKNKKENMQLGLNFYFDCILSVERKIEKMLVLM